MTRSLGKPEPLPYVDEDDLLDLAGDLGAGIFPGAEIYNWYLAFMEQAGRKPVSKTRFGLALKEAGWKPSTKYLDGRMVRCWMINKPWARRGQEKLTSEGQADGGAQMSSGTVS
jgi:phage/plasmid-associated DNA primase